MILRRRMPPGSRDKEGSTMPTSARTGINAAIVLLCLVLSSGRAVPAEISYEFRSQPQGVQQWLASQGFELRFAAGSASSVRIGLGDNGLAIETLGPAEPIIAKSNITLRQPAQLSIAWGVNRYPPGANWDVGANNEAIMVMIFFGTEKYSDGLFVPRSPYFIGFFLCERGRRNVPLSGRSYPTVGRYVCVDGPAAGQEVTSTIALDQIFRAAFRTGTVPPVSGFAIEADTTQVGRDARSSAWIKSIKITSAN
jgi:hypothetical protein